MFSKNTKPQDQQAIRELWGVKQENPHEKCLGLPSFVGQSWKSAFRDIKTKLWQKLNCWKEQLLSQSGKKQLLSQTMQ